MNSIRANFRTAVLLLLMTVCGASRADWATSTDPAAIRPLPDNMEVQAQNPPGFSWSRHASKPATYTLEITGPNGVMPLVTVSRNWYLPSTVLASGTYSWRVRPTPLANEWSTVRYFVIAAASTAFTVPEEASLKTSVVGRVRPRALPPVYPLASTWSAGQIRERGGALSAMKNDVLWRITAMTPVLDSEWEIFSSTANSDAKASQAVKMGQRISTAGRQLESAALLYRLTKEPRYLTEALLRGDSLAALSVVGPTSYLNQDQASRQIALSLIKGADLLWSEINITDAKRRDRWLASVAARTNAMYADLAGNDGRMDQYPFDSHGGSNLGYLAVISTLALGDIPEAETWFKFSFRSYANSIYAWSGPDGGFANGTAYAVYTADIALQLWQPMTQASGVNFFSKPWSTGFLRYFTEFVPPGTPQNVFGDQHELLPDYKLMKSFASRFASPLAAWYVNNISGTEDPMTLLQAPYPLPVSTVASVQAPPNGAWFKSIGWVAMHSDLAVAGVKPITSVYFKSSPYGAYNHSHGDQNGLVINSGGRTLLIESGWQDYYGSTMGDKWYRQTKAHNAVTFDNGIGQLVDGNNINLSRGGRIANFTTSTNASTTPPTGLDFVEGDAINAYGPVLSKARRQVWYIRGQDAVLVRDTLAAPALHVFEWNFHAPAPIAATELGDYKITNGDSTLCVKSIGPTATKYEKRVSPYAPMTGKTEDHAAFTLPAALSAEFFVLLDVGCKRPAVKVMPTATGWTVNVGTQSILVVK